MSDDGSTKQIPAQPEPGLEVLADRYELRYQVGKGATGAVWQGYDLWLKRPVAVKVVQLEGAKDPEMAERFRREGIAIAGIHDPGIVGVHDTGTDDERGWLVMDLLSGPNLAQLVKQVGPVPASVGIRLIGEVAQGLQAAHDAGITHRDVKPANIVLDAKPEADSHAPDLYQNPELGYPTLVDFGIARIVDEAGKQLTRPATAIGTAAYMSPEQARGRLAGPPSDVYSLACVSYFLMAGRPPFVAESSVAVAHAQAFDPPVPITELNPDIPPAFAALLTRMLAKDESLRPSAAEVATECAAICENPDKEPEKLDEVTAALSYAGTSSMMAAIDPYQEQNHPTEKIHRFGRAAAILIILLLSALLIWSWAKSDTPGPAPTVTKTQIETATASRLETHYVTAPAQTVSEPTQTITQVQTTTTEPSAITSTVTAPAQTVTVEVPVVTTVQAPPPAPSAPATSTAPNP